MCNTGIIRRLLIGMCNLHGRTTQRSEAAENPKLWEKATRTTKDGMLLSRRARARGYGITVRSAERFRPAGLIDCTDFDPGRCAMGNHAGERAFGQWQTHAIFLDGDLKIHATFETCVSGSLAKIGMWNDAGWAAE